MPDSPILTPLSSLSSAERSACLAAIGVVATDVDGTLTRRGALTPEVVGVISALVLAGFEVVPISGRPTGEVLGLCRYLPGVTRGIAENGLLEVVPDRPPRWLADPTDSAALRRAEQQLNDEHGAALRLAPDHPFRLGDLAYEREGRQLPELQRLAAAALTLDVCMVWSSVHIHLTPSPPDKGAGLLRFAADHGLDPATILTIGDAPNDEGLFVAGRFGVTVGTADIPPQRAAFGSLPRYVTDAREAEGFMEVAAALINR